MLLRSRPDTVHGFLLRKTQTSTSLIRGSFTAVRPRFGITPARADCRYRAPLSPRLHGLFNYTGFLAACQAGGGTKRLFLFCFFNQSFTLLKQAFEYVCSSYKVDLLVDAILSYSDIYKQVKNKKKHDNRGKGKKCPFQDGADHTFFPLL